MLETARVAGQNRIISKCSIAVSVVSYVRHTSNPVAPHRYGKGERPGVLASRVDESSLYVYCISRSSESIAFPEYVPRRHSFSSASDTKGKATNLGEGKYRA